MAAVFCALVLRGCAAEAAQFLLTVPKPAVKVGEEGVAYIELVADKGEKVVGGRLTLTVNPQYLMLSAERGKYASDEMFSLVELFKVDPVSGMAVYNVKAIKAVVGAKIFLKVPVKFVQAGVSSVSFSSSLYYADGGVVASNAGYQRVAGVTGPVDPMLYSSLVGENGTLRNPRTVGDIDQVRKSTDAVAVTGEGGAEIGVHMADATSDSDADVVVEFSKTTQTIGLNQWVRLDIVISKFPSSDILAGGTFEIKYDPRVLQLTDKVGQAATQVELDKQGLFSMEFMNVVNNRNGEVFLSVGLNFSEQNAPVPANMATLYFKGVGEADTSRVIFNDVLLPVSDASLKVLKRDAVVSVSRNEAKCDPTVPATLCKGTFKVTGDVLLSLANKNETQRFSTNTETGRTSTVKVKKYYLEQTWNMRMDGSFRNGIRLQGSLRDSPYNEQAINIEMIGNEWKADFGDFNTSFAESKFVSFNSSELTGLMLNYKHKALKMRVLSAEKKSATVQTTIAGLGHIGPYKIPVGIIPSSLRVYRNNEQIPDTDYILNLVNSEIKFKTAVPAGETVVLSYQQSTLSLFSSGNIQAFRFDYGPEDLSYNIGSTYFTTASPKNDAQIKSFAQDTFNASQAVYFDVSTKVKSGVDLTKEESQCQVFSSNKCYVITLPHQFIVKDSVVIRTKGTQELVYRDNQTAYVYIGHRGYFYGKILLNADTFAPLNVTVEYSYYNLQFMNREVVLSYNLDAGGNWITGSNWPVDMFPGSEMLYLSDNSNSDITQGSDKMMCYKDDAMNDYDIDAICNPADTTKTYILRGQDSSTYPEFSGTDTKTKLKLKYYPVPPDVTSVSEFQKTAWDVDARFKIGKKIDIDGEYSVANSDMSSSYITVTDEVLVKTDTSGSYSEIDTDSILPGACLFVQSGNSVGGVGGVYSLKCKLRGDKIVGNVQIQIQKCDYDAEHNQGYVDTGTYRYTIDPNLYDVLIPSSNIDRVHGIVKMDKTDAGWQTFAPFNKNLSNLDMLPRGYPVHGDKLFITYTYDQSLSSVVSGGAYNVNASFKNKLFSLKVQRRELSPLFDKSLSNYKDTSYSNVDMTVSAFKRWSLVYKNSKSLIETVNDQSKVVSSSMYTPSTLFSATYLPGSSRYCPSPCQPDKSLKISAFSLQRNLLDSVSTSGGAKTTDSSKDTIVGALRLAFRNNKYTADFMSTDDTTRQRVGTQPDSKSKSTSAQFHWKPSYKYSTDFNLSKSTTLPSGGGTDTRDYNLTLKPISLFSLETGFSRTNSRQSRLSSSVVQERSKYNLVFPKLRKINVLSFSFTRDQQPGGTIASPNAIRNDNLNVTFNMPLKKRLSIRPGYTRTVSSTAPSTRTANRNKTLSADYGRKIGKKGNLATNYSHTTATSESGIAVITRSSNKTDSIGSTYTPSQKTMLRVSIDRISGSATTSRTRKLSYSKTLIRDLNFAYDYSHTKSFSLSPTFNTTYSLRLMWRLSQETNFTLNYSQTKSGTATGGNLPGTNTVFSTELRSFFR